MQAGDEEGQMDTETVKEALCPAGGRLVVGRAAAGASLQTFAGLVFSTHSLEGSQQRKEMEGLDF